MPVTPTRKVTNVRQLPSGRANASHFGGQVAQANQQLGGAVQKVAADADNISQRHDAYVAKNAYLDSRKQAMAFADEQLMLQGENAFNAPLETQAYLDNLEQQATEKMTQRQKNLFQQNWKPAKISDYERVSVHTQKQAKVAEQATNGALVDQAALEFVHTGDQLQMSALDASMDTLGKSQGWTAEQLDGKKQAARSHAVGARIDALIGAEDFDGAEKVRDDYADMYSTEESAAIDLQIQQRRDQKAAKEARAARVKLDEANTWLAVEKIDGGPKYTPPESRFIEHFGPEMGKIKYHEELARTTELVDAQAVADAEMPTYFSVSQRIPDLYKPGADPSEGILLLNELENYDSANADALRASIKKAMGGGQPTGMTKKAMDKEMAATQAEIFSAYNELNNGWGKTHLGKGFIQTTPTGSVKLDSESARLVMQEMAEWDVYVASAQATEGDLGIKRLRELKEEFFYDPKQGILTAVGRKQFLERVATNRQYDPARRRNKGMFYGQDKFVEEERAKLLREIEQSQAPKG